MIRAALAALLLWAAPAAAQEPARLPVAARDLARGEVLAKADIAFAPAGEADAADLPTPLGWVTRRVVEAGEVLRAPTVAPPDLVRAGDAVEVVWRAGSLELRLRGRAMGSAAEGEDVLVHVDAQRRVEGVVVGPGLVRVKTEGSHR